MSHTFSNGNLTNLNSVDLDKALFLHSVQQKHYNQDLLIKTKHHKKSLRECTENAATKNKFNKKNLIAFYPDILVIMSIESDPIGVEVAGKN